VVVVAPARRDLRRPKQTVHPAKRRRTKATSVIQNAGAVLVLAVIPRPFISCRTRAKRAISIAKATSVTSAARNDTNEATSMTVT